MGSSTIVVTNSDPAAARAIASEIADEMYSMKRQFEPRYINATDAVREATTSASGPVVLLDMGDNVGGGSPANGMELLHAIRSGPSVSAFACIYDPEAVTQADLVSAGGRIAGLDLGDPANPLHADFRVQSVSDGKFSEKAARHGGFTNFDQGRTAVLEMVDSRITVMVTSRRMPPFSLNQLTSFGIDPLDYQIIVAKGVIAPIAAYEGIAARFVHVNTAGVTCAEMQRLDYRNRRRPMFPFEDDDVV
jgi:microcystin degradation protein MlrC